MSMKNSSDTIGNRTHDVPGCSAVPQPTAPPRAPLIYVELKEILHVVTMYSGQNCYTYCDSCVHLLVSCSKKTANSVKPKQRIFSNICVAKFHKLNV
jgi:hypothetical protein